MRAIRLSPCSLPLLCLPLALAACHTWRPQAEPAPALARMGGRGTVRVVRYDRGTVVLSGARVEGDSILGTAGRGNRVSVAVAGVERLDAREASVAKTRGLVLGVIGVAALAAAMVALASAFRNNFSEC